jgi:hypothetical protein
MAASLHLGEFVPPVLVLAAYALVYWWRVRVLARHARPVARGRRRRSRPDSSSSSPCGAGQVWAGA